MQVRSLLVRDQISCVRNLFDIQASTNIGRNYAVTLALEIIVSLPSKSIKEQGDVRWCCHGTDDHEYSNCYVNE